jgi:hypothetical protein
MTYKTKQEIVDELVGELRHIDAANLKVFYPEEDDLFRLHHTYGQHIRNDFKLWEAGNPLTQQWFKDCAFAEEGQHQYMIDGVDHHPQHPDRVSHEIIVAVWKYVHENYNE